MSFVYFVQHTTTHTSPSTHSLAPPEGSLHTLTPVSLIVVDEREGQGDVEGVGPARSRRPFPCFKCDGEVHPGCRTLGFEALDKVLSEDLAQHGFEGQVYANCAIRTSWEENYSFGNCKFFFFPCSMLCVFVPEAL